MDKNAIKKFAVWARQELISRVAQKALQFGIAEDKSLPADAVAVNDRVLSSAEQQQRKALLAQIEAKGYKQVMEEVVYTWFNRFCALRFMEVNEYLPSFTRVFSDESGAFRPQILKEALYVELDELNRDKVIELKQGNKEEALFKYLIISQCNALNGILPGMFQRIADYTELLFPDNLLREGSVVQQLVTSIPEKDWRDAVQIIGWLYQYYNSEKKDAVFEGLKKNIKITKENIPAATQLFTPDWIVRYMVENSLGRLWVEGHPNASLKSSWKYYLEEAEQEPEIQAQLADIRKEYAKLTPEAIKCIDPCCGSGHICVYMFDVFMQIYESFGYTARDAVRCILEKNLYGLDIDERAAQLAYFAVMMKARQYDHRFFSRRNDKSSIPQPHVYEIRESNSIDEELLDYFSNGDAKLASSIRSICHELHDAKEYGSIITITPVDFAALYARFEEICQNSDMLRDAALSTLLQLVQVAEALALRYDAVVTNPPYMGTRGMNTKISEFVKENYPNSKTDLYAAFMERCMNYSVEFGIQSMITMHSWMSLSSFEKLRFKLMNQTLINMVHLGARAFEEIGGEIVQTTSFILRNNIVDNYKSVFCRLVEAEGQWVKEQMFLLGINRFETTVSNFAKIPGSPIAYWISNQTIRKFDLEKVGSYVTATKGLDTCDNETFVRNWFEVSLDRIGFNIKDVSDTFKHKWFPYAKGGGFRKWYGFRDYVVNWENDGIVLRNLRTKEGKIKSRPQNTKWYFKTGLTWSTLTGYKLSLRFMENSVYGGGGAAIFTDNHLIYICALMNSKVGEHYLSILNPTINFLVSDILSLPLLIKKETIIDELVNLCIRESKKEYDVFETSWDFVRHPLVRKDCTLAEVFGQWQQEAQARFDQLKANEEELNRIFIDIYGLQDELTPEVKVKDVTVRLADKERDVKSLISYAVAACSGVIRWTWMDWRMPGESGMRASTRHTPQTRTISSLSVMMSILRTTS